MSKYWSPLVNKLTPYIPGEQPPAKDDLIKLNTNENPFAPSPKVIEAIHLATNKSLCLYPDPEGVSLKQTIANYYNLRRDQVFLGNGSDEVLAHVFHALLKHDNKLPVLFPDITYSFYPVYCGLYGIDHIAIEVTEEFYINLEDYNRANSGIIFPNPNAPTGILLPLEAIIHILERNTESVVVIDEAYIDFGGESAVSLIKRYPNLLVVQTFSKSRSLAGLRVGFAMGHRDLIEALERVKNSFNSYPLDRLALVGAQAAIKDDVYFNKTCKQIIDNRHSLIKALEELHFTVLPSKANFVFVSHKQLDADLLAAKLRERSIIVRHFNKTRINRFLRISIGTAENNQALIAALTDILN